MAQPLRNSLPHSAFGNNLEVEAGQAHTARAPQLFVCTLIFKEAPSLTQQRGQWLCHSRNGFASVLCRPSDDSKIFGKEPCCINEALNSFQYPGRKKKCRFPPYIIRLSWSSLGWVFGRL